MSEDIKHIKNKNIIHEDDNDFSDEYDKDDEYYNEIDEYAEVKYLKDTSYYIYSSIIDFVNDKSLPLCEYLKPTVLEAFINNNF